jgi:hypothetical protein
MCDTHSDGRSPARFNPEFVPRSTHGSRKASSLGLDMFIEDIFFERFFRCLKFAVISVYFSWAFERV